MVIAIHEEMRMGEKKSQSHVQELLEGSLGCYLGSSPLCRRVTAAVFGTLDCTI